ncbi:hypothetical protein OPV22_010822 [Ensete ventricosum]|uniref:Uncharacterized protein n=1 Tax=Ensete ventricosum TaxID=4639 RepID=A0AAV8Q3K0_ENSVE|nr:hypothetical protein OPV22_010822 [Ensete ventricosum]
MENASVEKEMDEVIAFGQTQRSVEWKKGIQNLHWTTVTGESTLGYGVTEARLQEKERRSFFAGGFTVKGGAMAVDGEVSRGTGLHGPACPFAWLQLPNTPLPRLCVLALLTPPPLHMPLSVPPHLAHPALLLA